MPTETPYTKNFLMISGLTSNTFTNDLKFRGFVGHFRYQDFSLLCSGSSAWSRSLLLEESTLPPNPFDSHLHVKNL